MKTLIFTLITLSFAFSHAGRIDNYYRDVARTGALKPRSALKSGIKPMSGNLDRAMRYKELGFFAVVGEVAKKENPRNMEIVEYFLKEGVSPDVKVSGTSALHIAAQSGNIKLVKLLLKYGANANIQDALGRIPLHLAETPEIAIALIKKGADVNAGLSRSDFTPLHMVETPEVAIALIEKGANVNAETKYGTPLHFAVSPEIARILIEKGANVNAVGSEFGLTPLHRNIKSSEMARTFIEKGANVNARDNEGKTPLHTATPEVARILIEKGASLYVRDNEGKTPLDTASSPEVARILKEASEKQ